MTNKFDIFNIIKGINNKLHEHFSTHGSIKFGDIIGVSKIFYEHYGIYTGNHMVIHYTKPAPLTRKLIIRKTPIENFLNGFTTYFILDCEYNYPEKSKPILYNEKNLKNMINAYLDFYRNIKIYSPEETVQRAESRLYEEEYNLFTNNCEHFAIWCKTGISKSYQIERFLELVPRIHCNVNTIQLK
ncbi:MAG: lecithin retinol acyltransferase family protein [Clostridia bacterium]|nr:lecithin retinol acyltransferase family protein [Clostridia bacterium]MDD4048154.1 lecithin retinol acyltransferase family protein [Clostridia bacterium]